MAEMRLEGCERCSAGSFWVKRFACRHEKVGGVYANSSHCGAVMDGFDGH